MTRPPFDPVTDEDIAVVSEQLGRPARNVVGIAARCVCGRPTVVSTAPRLDDGTPFPTFYYLTHPAATAAMSALEATQVMNEYNELLGGGRRARAPSTAPRTSSTSPTANRSPWWMRSPASPPAGCPSRVKCLHALAAHALAAGPGVNPIGDLALARGDWSPAVCECRIDVAG